MIKKSPPYQCLNSWMRSEIVKAFTRSGVKWTLCIMKNLEMAHSTQKLQNDCKLIVKQCKHISLFVCASDRFQCNGRIHCVSYALEELMMTTYR
jgi:hypothetical protein